MKKYTGKDGRAVEGARLEIVCGATHRGFESLLFRQEKHTYRLVCVFFFWGKNLLLAPKEKAPCGAWRLLNKFVQGFLYVFVGVFPAGFYDKLYEKRLEFIGVISHQLPKSLAAETNHGFFRHGFGSPL